MSLCRTLRLPRSPMFPLDVFVSICCNDAQNWVCGGTDNVTNCTNRIRCYLKAQTVWTFCSCLSVLHWLPVVFSPAFAVRVSSLGHHSVSAFKSLENLFIDAFLVCYFGCCSIYYFHLCSTLEACLERCYLNKDY